LGGGKRWGVSKKLVGYLDFFFFFFFLVRC